LKSQSAPGKKEERGKGRELAPFCPEIIKSQSVPGDQGGDLELLYNVLYNTATQPSIPLGSVNE